MTSSSTSTSSKKVALADSMQFLGSRGTRVAREIWELWNRCLDPVSWWHTWRCGALVKNKIFQSCPISASPTINPRVCIVPELQSATRIIRYCKANMESSAHSRAAFKPGGDVPDLNRFCYQLFSSRYFEALTWPSGTEATSKRRRLVMLVAGESPRVTSDWEQERCHPSSSKIVNDS